MPELKGENISAGTETTVLLSVTFFKPCTKSVQLRESIREVTGPGKHTNASLLFSPSSFSSRNSAASCVLVETLVILISVYIAGKM